MVDAMKRCRDISNQMGAAAIVLDVLTDAQLERRWKFYLDLGFRTLGDPRNPHRVFIPMRDVSATLA
jgi:hypothetical protein